MRRRRGLGALLAPMLLLPAVAAAQQPDRLAEEPRPWMGWSPLADRSVLPRGEALEGFALPDLLAGAPRIGAFWLAGNPAGLPWEVGDPQAELAIEAGGVDGSFRRPLEAEGTSRTGAVALGWQPVGDRAVLAGHAAYDETSFDPGTHTTAFVPHGSVPFVVGDSTRTPHRIQRVRLEGAGGRQLGPVGVGLSLGFEALNGNAQISRVPRLNKSARPAAAAGAVLPLRDGALRLGLHGRWAADAETTNIYAITGATIVTRVNGFAVPRQITLPPGTGSFYRRREADERAVGASLAGEGTAWKWVVFGEVGTEDEEQWTRTAPGAPRDTWDADVVSAGGAVQGSFHDDDLLVTLLARWASLEGRATFAQEDSLFFEADESLVSGVAEVRWLPAGSPWSARGVLEVGSENRDRGDVSPGLLRTTLEGLTTRIGGEVSHRISDAAELAAGYRMTRYSASGRAPRPEFLPSGIREWSGGETAYYVTPSTTHGISLAASWQPSEGTAFMLRVQHASRSARPGATRSEYQPEGSRSGWSFELGTVLR